MRRDLQDRLIDQLLREMLGGDRPRDMTGRVLAQAKIIDRFRRRTWLGIGSAVAAALALVIGLYFYWPHEYPGPIAGGGAGVEDGGMLERGQTVVTGDDQGTLNLGGYVMVGMSPDTRLNLGGSKYQEKVMLARGELDVDVIKHKGQFDIGVGSTTVHVTGTKFKVRVGEENTATEWVKKLYLAVKEGSVEVQNLPGGAQTETVQAGPDEHSYVLLRTSKNLSAGLLAAAQQAARVGARGGMVNAVTPRGAGANVQPIPVPQPNRGQNAGEPGLLPLTGDGTVNRPVNLQTTPAGGNRIGHVLRTGTIFYLESSAGNFYMFERSGVPSSHAEWLNVPADQYTRVVWAEGAVSRLEKYTPPPTGTTTPR